MSDCIFCKIVSGEIKTEFVDEMIDAVLIKDKNPLAPHHVLAISKEHASSGCEMRTSDAILDMYAMLCAYAYKNGLDKTGYRILTNSGKDAGQTVNHFHMHLLGGAELKNDFGAK